MFCHFEFALLNEEYQITKLNAEWQIFDLDSYFTTIVGLDTIGPRPTNPNKLRSPRITFIDHI